MNRNHFSYDTSSGKMAAHFSSTKESFGAVQTNSLWDNTRKHLVIIVETTRMFTDDIEIQLKENRLTIEAPLLAGRETLEGQTEIEDGISVIGFSTIRLKQGYKYTHLSSKAIDSNMIKVILEYQPLVGQS